MPEGDTLARTAARLHPALVGAQLESFHAPRLGGTHPRPGTRIDDVRAVGKHLLISFEGDLVLRTHLRMSGSWHLYRPGERWRKPERYARVWLGVPDWVAVCFSAPVVELTRSGGRQPSGVAHLGPDLCLAEVDSSEVVERMGRVCSAEQSIAEVLLDQRVAAGIGNVYKSEVLWAVGVDPFRPLGEIDLATRHRLVERAHRLLRANLGSGRRTTVAGPPGTLAVYGRAGATCRRCEQLVQMRRHTDHARSTYWCPGCQTG